ncbi:isoaspartyl peptidase/L-asparaginase, partial [Altererythrobacter sp. JGD-16]|nr:isoaspartyl peptidase/L-asparaginase [Altererythrobacter lutimaris]
MWAAALALGLGSAAQAQDGGMGAQQAPEWALTIHGGAGVIERDKLSPEKDAEIRAALNRALAAGSKVLAEGGAAMDAITATITVLEDD